jgi:hypothetical protein
MKSAKRRLVVLAVVPLLALGLAGPAMGSGAVMPPTIPDTPENRFGYELIFGPTNPEWVPQGTIIADSGFRPTPNGLPYLNYGASLASNALFFNTPAGPLTPMDSFFMRSLYGDGVCQSAVQADGSCALTPAARYMSMAIFDTVNGVGHCVGFAITAAGLYNGQIDPADVGASTLALQSVLDANTQSVIARNWTTQWTVSTTRLTPTGVVEALVEQLQPGQVPSALILQWVLPSGQGEGHGITPYAVYDKGNGLYDIAVYDNNFPFKERAIHVDTIADTWEYEVMLNPSSAPLIAEGDATTLSLQLMPVADALDLQPCPVCEGGRNTNLVVFAPVPTTVIDGLDVGFLDSQGNPLTSDRLSQLPSLDSANPDLAAIPGFDVAPANGFAVTVSTSPETPAFPFTLSDLSSQGTKEVSIRNFPSGAEVVTDFDAAGQFAVLGTTALKPRMAKTFNEGVRWYESVVYGGTPVAPMNGRAITLRRSDSYVAYGDGRNAGGSMTITVSLERQGESRKFRAVNAAYPAGGQLVVDYSSWKRINQRPAFGVDTNGDGKINQPIRMKRVR